MSRRTREHRKQAKARQRSFNEAMIEVIAEDLHASPCIICEQPGVFTGVWMPSAECIARELSGDPARQRSFLYRLCEVCASRSQRDRQFMIAVEREVLRLWRAGYAHRIQDGVSVPS